MNKVALFLAGEKGFRALEAVLGVDRCKDKVVSVMSARDPGVTNDYSDEMQGLCVKHHIPFSFRGKGDVPAAAEHLVAIGWRWMIHDERPLVIFHDSLLPRYRGFNPLVTALINGDEHIGVTAIHATGEFDEGDILLQSSIDVVYPMKIKDAIEKVSVLYAELLVVLLSKEDIWGHRVHQDESKVTYSLWRDSEDYRIEWKGDSHRIARMVDAVGDPYLGALTDYCGNPVRVLDVTVLEDLAVENRTAGKILRIKDNRPEVVCGSGMVRIDRAVHDSTGETVEFNRLRVRLF